MNAHSFKIIALMAVAIFGIPTMHANPAATETEAQVDARREALEVAGAFSNDGYKIRDGHWCDHLDPKSGKLVQVNLYAGNAYWFSAAATPQAKTIAVTVFDEKGQPVKIDTYQDGPKAAAGFMPEASGAYYIKVQELEGEPATFCLVYSYK